MPMQQKCPLGKRQKAHRTPFLDGLVGEHAPRTSQFDEAGYWQRRLREPMVGGAGAWRGWRGGAAAGARRRGGLADGLACAARGWGGELGVISLAEALQRGPVGQGLLGIDEMSSITQLPRYVPSVLTVQTTAPGEAFPVVRIIAVPAGVDWKQLQEAEPLPLPSLGSGDGLAPLLPSQASLVDAGAEEPADAPANQPSSPPAESKPRLPSEGSQSHFVGRCKPCAFVHTAGCQQGQACRFCHLCEPGEKKRRRKVRLEDRRAARQSKLEQRCGAR